MLRPETAQELLDLVRQSGLVEGLALGKFSARLSPSETRDRVLSLLVTEGLLTRYQAAELIGGQWKCLWLGGYRVLDRLGKGGMSHVYLAEHGVMGKRVAVKVLSADLRADKVARRRFLREARTAAAIQHPNIVHVVDVDMDHDPPYLVMEYVEGVSLQAAIASSGTMSAGEAAAIGTEVTRGLAVAAAAGLVHRDIKPANLLLDRQGGVKILDLGIVRLVGDDTHPPGSEVEEILGTIDYLAPEQAQNSARVDARADLYALGATLYFLLAGHPPFPGSDLRHKLAAKQFTDPPPIHRLRPDIEQGLSDIIHRLLARDPAERYQSATQAGEDFARFAALPENFPARYFRTAHTSTIADDMVDDVDLLTISPTQSIRKPGFSSPTAFTQEPPTPSKALASPIEDGQAETEGPQTVRLSKCMTDIIMEALPADFLANNPQCKQNQSTLATKRSRRWPRRLRWLVVIILALVSAKAAMWLLSGLVSFHTVF